MITIWGTPIISNVQYIIKTLKFELKKEGVYLFKDMKVSGNNLMVTCPFHKKGRENKPSMGISLSEDSAGLVNCFSCGYAADLPTFISDCFNKKDKGMFGYRWLTSNFVNVSVENRKEFSLNMDRKKGNKKEKNIVPEQKLEKYRYIHPYMYERKLTDNIINYFDVGYDEEENSITFPVKNLSGKVMFIIKRYIYNKQYYYEPKTSERRNIVYGLYEVLQNLSKINEVWVTEGPIDCLTCWTQKVASIATMGSMITEKQLELLQELPIRKIVLAFDNDEAGRKAEKTVTENINKLFYKVQYADPGDINEQKTPLKNLNLKLYTKN